MTKQEAIENLKILKEDYWDDDGYGHETKQYNDTMLALDMAIKALEQETRKSHWIPRNSFLLQYKCSECGWESEKYNYCSNCGAEMSEVEE